MKKPSEKSLEKLQKEKKTITELMIAVGITYVIIFGIMVITGNYDFLRKFVLAAIFSGACFCFAILNTDAEIKKRQTPNQ